MATAAGGLTGRELAAALAELRPLVQGAEIRDLARLEQKDDLLLFLSLADPAADEGQPTDAAPARTRPGHCALHIVTGGPRARLCSTTRKFRKAEFRTGPLIDRLQQHLVGLRILDVEQVPGERSCVLSAQQADGPALHLHIELFGARGLWVLATAQGRILELSRLPSSAGRELKPGATYAPPSPRPAKQEPDPRFEHPVLAAIDAHYTQLDTDREFAGLKRRLSDALDRTTRRLHHKIAGLERQRAEIQRVPEIRQLADLLLAYGFRSPPGAHKIEVPDPNDSDRFLSIPLEPGKPIAQQADKLYKKARKLEDSVDSGMRRAAEAEAELKPLLALQSKLEECSAFRALLDVQAELIDAGILTGPKAPTKSGPSAKERNIQKITKGFNFRRFTTIEGHLVLVGRTNHENDRLSISVARGNDMWFHVGQGYAGSHVVVRLPKDKSASLESLLDAGTLAIYFSKARNATKCEVIYTPAKNVRKPKGLPPGRVTTGNTKTLLIRVEQDRLRRLLDSGATS